MTNQIDPILMHVRMTPIFPSVDDRLQHCLEFGVVGTRQPAKVVISSDMYSQPVIEERQARGGIELPDKLIDVLAICCFKTIAGFVTDYDGECGTWTAHDVTAWLRRNFSSQDAGQIEKALTSQVTPGLVGVDQVFVGDDDVVLADDYR